MSERDCLVFYLNGQKTIVKAPEAFLSVADFLRYQKNLVGTKIVCAEGDCGACTILVLRPKTDDNFVPINACIAKLIQLDGAIVLTVEALKQNEDLSLVQKAIIKCHASQCGFCTPGFVMALTAFFEKKPQKLSSQKIKNALTGNLCRCTGYQSIIDAGLSLNADHELGLNNIFVSDKILSELKELRKNPLSLKTPEKNFFAPISLKSADEFLAANDARISSGATDLGVQINKRQTSITTALSLHLLDELYQIEDKRDRILVGALVNLEKLRRFCLKQSKKFASFIDIFASPQIKNMATLVGNIANASPIADCAPFLLISDAEVHLRSQESTRKLPLTKFYLDYKKLALKKGEYISHISFQKLKDKNYILHKFSRRRDLDISTVNCAFFMDQEKNLINDIKLAVGGLASIPKRLSRTESFLKTKELSPHNINHALELMHKEISPISDFRASKEMRRVLVENALKHFLTERLGGNND